MTDWAVLVHPVTSTPTPVAEAKVLIVSCGSPQGIRPTLAEELPSKNYVIRGFFELKALDGK